MFTGLIEEVGAVERTSRRGGGVQLVILAPKIAAISAVGDSIACNGVCLTIERLVGESFEIHAGTATIQRTTLGSWRGGGRVNLETALQPTDRLGGHFVQGHVDCVGVCTGQRRQGETVFFSFEIPPEQMAYVVEKGSIAVDGISLTVTEVWDSSFSVAIIPHTMSHTTLGEMRKGVAVNVECDILAKYVRRMLPAGGDGAVSSGITEDFLRDNGFMS
jgi:riboflavin synthase